ncbi:hypothetical protein PVAG01_08512 [Phlyctema vagabunda]|uniref:Uncharacterized protein n=1 Tax=Phlyctema vagabunda TaxID=108571 RepID=A0ABR4P9L3_9HELO
MSSDSTSTNNNNNPSLIGGHAQFAKGYVEEALGNATGSREWQESGKADSAQGIQAMKAAGEQRKTDPQTGAAGGVNPTTAKMEEVAGRLAGCEGMEKEGAEKLQKTT